MTGCLCTAWILLLLPCTSYTQLCYGHHCCMCKHTRVVPAQQDQQVPCCRSCAVCRHVHDCMCSGCTLIYHKVQAATAKAPQRVQPDRYCLVCHGSMKYAGRVLVAHHCSPLAVPAGHGVGRPLTPLVYPARGMHRVRLADTLPLAAGHLWHAAQTTKLCVRCAGSGLSAQIAKHETMYAAQSMFL